MIDAMPEAVSEPMPTVAEPDPRRLAEAWLVADPDTDHRRIVAELLDGDGEELKQRFQRRLHFGTAGLRGPLAPGPGAMNRVLVRVVASAIGKLVLDTFNLARVVVGFDARHQSSEFAEDTARVLAGLGIDVTLLDRPTPTPVLAFAVRHMDASAGIMVTASHNPRTDNGYKVYWNHGAQIRSPIDTEIADLIDATPLVLEDQLADLDDTHIMGAGDELISSYLDHIVELLSSDGHRTAKVAYTPLHGVGADTVRQGFAKAGFAEPSIVEEQAAPDPDFPTAPFPNPEESGVLDPLLRLATKIDADVAMANDPDADRLAVAVPVGSTWRLLTGDELGCLLAEYLLSRRTSFNPAPMVVNTVVSSRLLELIARHYGAVYEQTLTGFKWIMAAQDLRPANPFVLGYEEALGYCIGDVVRDKDGVSAALVVAEMVSNLAAGGRTLLDLLDDVHRREGVHITGQRSVHFESSSGHTPTTPLAHLRLHPPRTIGGEVVRRFSDLKRGDGRLPSTDAVVIGVDHGQVIVRPSGTEAKVKVYGETWAGPSPDNLVSHRVSARVRLQNLIDDVVTQPADPERQRTMLKLASDDDELESRASRLFSMTPTDVERSRMLRLLVRCIELTTLAGDDTGGRVRALCAQARRPDPADPTVGPTAAVCVYPAFVEIAAELMSATGIRVVSVAGAFPTSLSALSVRLTDITRAIEAGADEIEVVLNRSLFLSERFDGAAHELRTMRGVVDDTEFTVTIEVDELGSMGAIGAAATLAIEAGADWIKTSTGKAGRGATPAAALIMAEAIAGNTAPRRRPIGLKISGDVRTANDALGYMSIVDDVLGSDWLTPDRLRFAAPGLLRSVVADLTATEYNLWQSRPPD